MYGRNLFVAASLAVLTLAAPTPTSAVVQHEEAIVERRDAFSLTGLFRDVLKRHTSIEAIPDATFSVAIDRRSEGIEEEDGEDIEVDTIDESSEDLDEVSGSSKRGLNRPGKGGSGRRGLNRPGKGGSGKRGLNRPGKGGSGRRGLNRPGQGGSN